MKKNKFDIGGSMDILSYDLFRDKQNIERQKAELKNKVIPSSLAGMPKGLFSFGGNMGTNSSEYRLGQVYEVTEEEANRLKAMGYGFTVVG